MQESIAGIALAIIGLFMLICPELIWKISISWKVLEKTGPTEIYKTLMRIVGGILTFVGILVLFRVIH